MNRATLLILPIVTFINASHAAEQSPEAKARKSFERIYGRTTAKPASRETWKLFPRGYLPAGTFLQLDAAAALPEGDYSAQNQYVVGRFRVTATTEGKAVLRPTQPGSPIQIVRIIAEYPEASPEEGAIVEIDRSCAMQIRSVRRTSDAKQVNLLVRDITKTGQK
jgi:hypothetical protein